MATMSNAEFMKNLWELTMSMGANPPAPKCKQEENGAVTISMSDLLNNIDWRCPNTDYDYDGQDDETVCDDEPVEAEMPTEVDENADDDFACACEIIKAERNRAMMLGDKSAVEAFDFALDVMLRYALADSDWLQHTMECVC